VMVISVISVSSDSSEESVGTSTRRVILLGTIPTTIPDTTLSVIPPTTHIDTTPIPIVSPTIPLLPNYTPASPDYSPASDTEFDPSEDPSSDHIPPLPATLPFLSSTDDSSDSDTPYTPPSPTHGTPFTETTLFTQRSPVASGALRRRVMVLAPGQPIPHGRPYRYHLNGPVHMMTARKRRFIIEFVIRDFFAYALFDSASSHSSSDHSLPTPLSGMRPSHHLCSLVPSIHCSSAAVSDGPSYDSSSASPSRKRSRSPTASVPLSSPTLRAFSYARADLLPSPKRVKSPEIATDLEDCLEDESFEPSRGRGIDARVVVESIDREEIEMGMRGPVEVRVNRVTHPVVADDIPEPTHEGAVKVTYETLGDLVHRIVVTGQQSADMLERIRELERDNRRLRDMMDIASQRVARS
ncbi:hypothetical protein Tco_0190697, partial [Tanacetum coccineum]